MNAVRRMPIFPINHNDMFEALDILPQMRNPGIVNVSIKSRNQNQNAASAQ